MEIKYVALIILDISGYTRFMKQHTTSLLHAEVIITDLLETVIDHADYPLTLTKLEGDAAFLYAVIGKRDKKAAQDILGQVTAIFDAFKARERVLIACDACLCEACKNIDKLRLKAFMHVGPAVIRKIRQFEELAGEDVILIHRLLKNSITTHEYILMTEPFHKLSGGPLDHTSELRTENCEGIGDVPVRVFFPPEDTTPLPKRPIGPPIPGTKIGILSNRFSKHVYQRIFSDSPRATFAHLEDYPLTRLSFLSHIKEVTGHILETIRNMVRAAVTRPG